MVVFLMSQGDLLMKEDAMRDGMHTKDGIADMLVDQEACSPTSCADGPCSPTSRADYGSDRAASPTLIPEEPTIQEEQTVEPPTKTPSPDTATVESPTRAIPETLTVPMAMEVDQKGAETVEDLIDLKGPGPSTVHVHCLPVSKGSEPKALTRIEARKFINILTLFFYFCQVIN